jgi:hypothetical protein
MQSTMLTKLDICFGFLSNYTDLEQGMIREAFSSSASLEILFLESYDSGIFVIVLAGLKDGLQNASQSYQLNKLKRTCHKTVGLAENVVRPVYVWDHWVALAELVHVSTHLKHLLLQGIEFNN